MGGLEDGRVARVFGRGMRLEIRWLSLNVTIALNFSGGRVPEGGGVGSGGEIHHLVRRRLFRRSGVTSVVSVVLGCFLFGVSTILKQYNGRYPDF